MSVAHTERSKRKDKRINVGALRQEVDTESRIGRRIRCERSRRTEKTKPEGVDQKAKGTGEVRGRGEGNEDDRS